MGDHEKPGNEEESGVFTTAFWKDTAERTISSAAQGALTGFGIGMGVNEVVDSAQEAVNAYATAGWGALSMATLTFLKCLIAANVGKQTDVPVTPSFVDTKAA